MKSVGSCVLGLVFFCAFSAMADAPELGQKGFHGVLFSGFTHRGELTFVSDGVSECVQTSKIESLEIQRCKTVNAVLRVAERDGSADFVLDHVSIMRIFDENKAENHREYIYAGELKTTEYGVPVEERVLLQVNWGYKDPDRLRGSLSIGEVSASFQAVYQK